MTTSQPRQSDIDYLARDLYARYRRCSACHGLVTLAEQLAAHCPHCRAVILAGPIDPERARVMLDTLRARRVELGLSKLA